MYKNSIKISQEHILINMDIKILCSELLNKNISKTEQSSDWGGELTKNQQRYAATDVFIFIKLKNKLNEMLIREKRDKLAKACFDFIQHRTDLDINGWVI